MRPTSSGNPFRVTVSRMVAAIGRTQGRVRRSAKTPPRAGGLAIFTAALLLNALMAQAGPEHLIKQRAKDVANQNNQRQGVPATPPPPAPAEPTPVPAPARSASPVLSAQAGAMRDALAAVVKAGSATDETTKALQQSLAAATSGKAKPSDASLAKLARDLAKAVAGTDLGSNAQAQLAIQLESLLKTATSPQQAQTLTTATHDLLREAGVGRVDATVVANDLKVVTLELQQAGAK